MEKRFTHDVFGIGTKIKSDSYVDRGNLDYEITLLSKPGRDVHIALRGASKCGKSWLRQKLFPSGLVVQCRLKTTIIELYTDILSQLGITLNVSNAITSAKKFTFESSTESGKLLLLKVQGKSAAEQSQSHTSSHEVVGRDLNDLRFIAQIIKDSERRVIIEDFHYLSVQVRQEFAFDLKAFWDYECFMVIVGVWTTSNLLIHLNSDLMLRIEEREVTWTKDELKKILEKGSQALKIEIVKTVADRLVEDSYSNAGLLQALTLKFLDEEKILEEKSSTTIIGSQTCYESAAIKYAAQLEAKYQKFGVDVSSGIRKRPESTGIYGHTMAVIMVEDDPKLIFGVDIDDIYLKAHQREGRIQKGNLRKILQKIEELQVDGDGRGLVLAYNDHTSTVTAVDRTLLFYRKYSTVKWPWEDLILNTSDSEQQF